MLKINWIEFFSFLIKAFFITKGCLISQFIFTSINMYSLFHPKFKFKLFFNFQIKY